MSQPTPQAVAPRSDRAERTRVRILEAAGHCFASSGYAKTTVEAIAARAGVSKGIVYHHYRGKEEVLERVLEATLAEWSAVARMDEALVREGRVLDAIADVQRKAVAFGRDNPMARSLLQVDQAVLLTIADSREMRESAERHRQELIRGLEQGKAGGELRGDLDVEHAADILRIQYMGLIDQLLDPNGVEVTDALIEAGLDLLFHGMAASAPQPATGAER